MEYLRFSFIKTLTPSEDRGVGMYSKLYPTISTLISRFVELVMFVSVIPIISKLKSNSFRR